MRIIQVNSTYGIGSVGNMAVELTNQLETLGHNVYLFYATGNTDLENCIQIGWLLDHRIHALMSRITGLQGYFSYFATAKLIRQIKFLKPDIVHLHNLHSNFINLRMLLKFLAESDIATVVTLHDCWYYTGKCTHYIHEKCQKWQAFCGNCPLLYKDNVNPTWFFDRTKKCLRDKRKWFNKIPRLAIIGVSKWAADEAAKSIFSIRNPRCVYNWVDTNVFFPQKNVMSIRETIDAVNKFVILMVCTNINENKGYNEMCMLADQCDKSYQIILIGKNPLELQIPENVLYIPFTENRTQLAEYYSVADVCINTTRCETFGLVTAEAICCGTPVIVYNNTASPELVPERCGIVVDESDDMMDLLDAVQTIRSRGKAFYSKACVEFGFTNFGMENKVKQYVRVYEDLINARQENSDD